MTTTVKKILITGASGYVDQHLIASLGFLGLAPPARDAADADDGQATNSKDDDTRYELYCACNSLATFQDDLKELFNLNCNRTRRLHPPIAKIVPIPNIDFFTDGFSAQLKNACNSSVDVIVHLAALSSPAYCEKNPDDAWKVNCPLELHKFSVKVGAPIIYLSTDQVHQGTNQFYNEDGDETLPVNIYGRTKLAFERALLGKSPLLSEGEIGGSDICKQHAGSISKITKAQPQRRRPCLKKLHTQKVSFKMNSRCSNSRGRSRFNNALAVSCVVIFALGLAGYSGKHDFFPSIMLFAVASEELNADDFETNAIVESDSEVIDADLSVENQDGGTDDSAATNSDKVVNSDPSEETHLPPSIAKATLVGAKLRGDNQGEEDATNESGTDEAMKAATTDSMDDYESLNFDRQADGDMNSNAEGQAPRNPKPPLTGCHWGAAGCNKGNKIPLRHNLAANASASGSSGADVAPQSPSADAGSSSSTAASSSASSSSSSFAGSTTAAIEARVMEARGVNRKPKNASPSTDHTAAVDDHDPKETETDIHPPHNPPQGFHLTARIVTSPSDGLAYFLDGSSHDPNNEEHEWLMSIPYTYVECGPTIESSTEAFSLTDFMARHFPFRAVPNHWVNLGGGVTMDSDDSSIGEDGEMGPRYLNGNLHDGHPKLLVALSEIEITVSGNNEEMRVFQPGDVLLLEDTLGKGHKMRAVPSTGREVGDGKTKAGSHGQDLSVLLISLPHTIHQTIYDWNDHAEKAIKSDPTSSNSPNDSSTSSGAYSGAQHSLFGLRPKHNRHGNHPRGNFQIHKPCPLEYDSAYSSLFKPVHTRRGRHRTRRRDPHWKKSGRSASQSSPFDDTYHPPPGLTTYSQREESALLQFLPSLRRTMLVGLGLSLTSSFVYCIQLLYPPLLALWGGATVVLVGSVLNVAGMRFGYQNWIAIWEEEWRWRREVKNQRKKRARLREESVQDSIVDNTGESANEDGVHLGDTDGAPTVDDVSFETEDIIDADAPTESLDNLGSDKSVDTNSDDEEEMLLSDSVLS